MPPKISVIVPCSRGVEEIESVIGDFRKQTYKDFELILVYDGLVPDDVIDLLGGGLPGNIVFHDIPKSTDSKEGRGTTPRNYGLSVSSGEYVVYCDDDDRYRSTYLESLMNFTCDNRLTVVQMMCPESRCVRNGRDNYYLNIPEIGIPIPSLCHIGTPCFVVKREWAMDLPWRDEPNHDYHFYKRIVDKYKPEIFLNPVVMVDVDGKIIGGKVWR